MLVQEFKNSTLANYCNHCHERSTYYGQSYWNI